MRTTVKVTLASLALIGLAGAIAACSDARATDTTKDADLSRDLELASAATMALAGRAVDSANLASLETKPLTAPEASSVVKRGAGTKAMRSASPTVRAIPVSQPAAVEGEGESFAEEASAAESGPVAVLPIPAPVATPASAPAGDYGSGGGIVFGDGSGRGGSGGGVVIRGGGVDGDNCELHRRRPRGGTRSPVYVPATIIPAPTPSPSRGTVGIGSRNPGRTERPQPVSSSPRPARERADPRTARRGL